jgi:multidrug efflux pump subunit AcrA (membrane-fusion protein)
VERDVEDGIAQAFRRIEQDILDRLQELGDMKAELQVSQVFNYDTALAEIEPAIREAVLAALSEGLSRGQARLGISQAQRVRELAPDVVELMIRRSKFVNVVQTTEDQIAKETMIQRITAQVRQTFEGIRANRIPAIVNTTVNSAFESGQMEAFRISAVQQKQWLSQRDGKVRESHDLVDGQQVAINQAFDVMGVPLEFPGDPGGPPEEIINCRCTMIPVT